VSFAANTLCIASQQVFTVVIVYFVIDLVRKLLDTHLDTAYWPKYRRKKTMFFEFISTTPGVVISNYSY
jgi:uncharacterized protein HemY